MTVADGEPVVDKYDRSAFAGTALDGLLRDHAVREVVSAGLVTEGGIASTAADPNIWNQEWALEYLEDTYTGLVAFFHAAAVAGDSVLIWTS